MSKAPAGKMFGLVRIHGKRQTSANTARRVQDASRSAALGTKAIVRAEQDKALGSNSVAMHSLRCARMLIVYPTVDCLEAHCILTDQKAKRSSIEE